MTKDEFTTAVEGTVERRGIQIREVSNGFVFVATRTFRDVDTDTDKFSLSIEGVAQDTNLVLNACERFFKTGDPAGQAPA